jgi:hypothetical protein
MAIVMFIAAWLTMGQPLLPTVLGSVAVLMTVLALSFHHLTIEDQGNRLVIRFGPLTLFRTSVPFEEIESVEIGRTTLLDCCGIHWSLLHRGWVWSLWGRDCVVVRRRRCVLRVGTDDASNLAFFLQSKIQRGLS